MEGDKHVSLVRRLQLELSYLYNGFIGRPLCECNIVYYMPGG